MQVNLAGNMLCGLYMDEDRNMVGTYTAEGIKAIAQSIAVNTSASITSIGKDGLNLKGNRLGDEGWGAIFAAVCSSEASKITSVDASREKIGPEGAKLIGQALRNSANASLTDLNLADNEIGGHYDDDDDDDDFIETPEGTTAIADALRVNSSLTELSVADNNLGPSGAQAIAEGIKATKSLKKLDISNRNGSSSGDIKSEGAKYIAEAIANNASLTEVLAFRESAPATHPRLTACCIVCRSTSMVLPSQSRSLRAPFLSVRSISLGSVSVLHRLL